MVDRPDDEPVFDLEDQVSDPEDRERLVREASALSEVRDARYRLPGEADAREAPWRLVLAGLLLCTGLLFLVRPPALVRPEPAQVPSASDLDRGVRAALRAQAAQVEAFRALEGRLPETLDEVGHRFPGIRYVRSNSRVYQLVAAAPAGEAVVYDSARPQPGFDDAAPWILRP